MQKSEMQIMCLILLLFLKGEFMKVFISGPMTGYEDNNRAAVMEAENLLVGLGLSVFNPAWLYFSDEWSNSDIMAIDIAALSKCDAIYMLPGWTRSAGSMAEYKFAEATNKTILYKEEVIASGKC